MPQSFMAIRRHLGMGALLPLGGYQKPNLGPQAWQKASPSRATMLTAFYSYSVLATQVTEFPRGLHIPKANCKVSMPKRTKSWQYLSFSQYLLSTYKYNNVSDPLSRYKAVVLQLWFCTQQKDKDRTQTSDPALLNQYILIVLKQAMRCEDRPICFCLKNQDFIQSSLHSKNFLREKIKKTPKNMSNRKR